LVQEEPIKFQMQVAGFPFRYRSHAWRYDTICNVLRHSGFSDVRAYDYMANPEYTGNVDIVSFKNAYKGQIIVAIK